MIKVEKDLSDVPASLNSTKTNQRRKEVVKARGYPKDETIKTNPAFTATTISTYNNRYKHKDIKEQLEFIYNHKCAYCEQSIEGYHVEHYRPKDIYYWLAYSWDNLLYCCSICNTHKSKKFDVAQKVSIGDLDITDIHNLRDIYDKHESPKFINPEKEAVHELILYDKEGKPSSHDIRTKYTIVECKLDREKLNDKRLQLLNEFKTKVDFRVSEKKNGNTEAVIKLRGLIEDFITDSKNPIKEFISFRKYIIKNWLKELIQELS